MTFIARAWTLSLAAASLWSAPHAAAAQTEQRSLLRQLYGDLAVDVRTRGQGSLTIGVAGSRDSLVITLMATDLRRWSDSATRILAARPRRGQTVTWQAVVAGPGIAAGSMVLARTITPTDTTIVLLVADSAFHAVRTTLGMEEARALAGAMKRAAGASLPTRPAPLPKAKAAPLKKPPVRPPR